MRSWRVVPPVVIGAPVGISLTFHYGLAVPRPYFRTMRQIDRATRHHSSRHQADYCTMTTPLETPTKQVPTDNLYIIAG